MVKGRWHKANDFIVGQALPFVYKEVPAFKGLVIRVSHWLIIRVVVLSKVGMRKSLGCCDPLIRVQNQHLFQQVDSQGIGTNKYICEVHLRHLGQRLNVVSCQETMFFRSTAQP